MKYSYFQFSFVLFLTAIIFSTPAPIHALTTKRPIFSSQYEAECYLTMHYNLASSYYQAREWTKAAREFENVLYYFPCSSETTDAYYYLGVCYFEKKEFDLANQAFSNYLKSSEHPEFFEDAIQYKFCMAESLKAGMKRRLFGMRLFPKISCGSDLALTIYDEVIVALPNCETSAQALFSKAEILKQKREYREAIEVYQTLIRRFPKNEIVPACYLGIQDTYCQQSRHEFQSPELIALAELNARRFSEEFPRDPRVAIANDLVLCVKEAYAREFCNTGLYFERKGKPEAAAIYFQSAIEEFPTTRVAKFCRGRLRSLGYVIEEDEVPSTNILQQKATDEDANGLGDRDSNPLGPELPTGPEAIREKAEGVPLIRGSLNEAYND